MRKQILHSSFFTIHLKLVPLHPQMTRALSSAGLEHLPYKQRVGGSNPSAPTTQERTRPQPWSSRRESSGKAERLFPGLSISAYINIWIRKHGIKCTDSRLAY